MAGCNCTGACRKPPYHCGNGGVALFDPLFASAEEEAAYQPLINSIMEAEDKRVLAAIQDALLFDKLRKVVAFDPNSKYNRPERTITFTVKGEGCDQFVKLLEVIRDCCSAGSSTDVVVKTGSGCHGEFNFDGDGADRIISIDAVKHVYNDEGSK